MAVPARVLFLNENLGGHATVHLGIRHAIPAHPEISATFLDVPPPGLPRRAIGAHVPMLGRLDLDFQPLRAQLAQSMVARRLLRVADGAYDVLHVYTQHAALGSTHVLRRSPCVVSTDATGDQVSTLLPYRLPTRFTPAQNRLRHRFEEPVFAAATLVVAKSAWAADSLREHYGVPDDKLRVIPLGIVLPETRPVLPSSALPRVTFVGTTLWRKGGHRLLRVFRSVLRGRCELNLVTRETLAPEPGVRVFPDLIPGDPRLAAVLSGTAVFVLPTEMDSFGNAALEAMGAGVPVVATRMSALPEVVEDGVTGILVEPDDRALARAIETLLDDEALRRRMGAAGRARVCQRFDARVTTGRLVEVLMDARERFRAARRVD